jgi:hypothetical protein
LSYGKISALLKELTGLEVSRSALCRALLRMGKKLEPLYEELKAKIQSSAVVYLDETGWREGGHSMWLWVFTNRSETVYSIQPRLWRFWGRAFAGCWWRSDSRRFLSGGLPQRSSWSVRRIF